MNTLIKWKMNINNPVTAIAIMNGELTLLANIAINMNTNIIATKYVILKYAAKDAITIIDIITNISILPANTFTIHVSS